MAYGISPAPFKTGLIMTGGGARAAYQVGVLKAIAEMLPRNTRNPFPIICGVSAGAINATALAASAAHFHFGVKRLLAVWSNFEAGQVYRADAAGVAACGARWLAALLLGGLGRNNPASLLDNGPLSGLLAGQLDFSAVQSCIDSGDLYALSVTASGYTSGQSISFFQGVSGIEPWQRARRLGVAAQIGLEHLLASSALPFIFPAVHINREYFGDGSMRQIAPISPALHLGADRVLVIGSARGSGEQHPDRIRETAYPTLAQIAGHALSSIFLDTMETDLERLQRINRTISLIPSHALRENGLALRKVDFLVISPSEEIEKIAEAHAHALPRPIRSLLRGVGAMGRRGSHLVSYLLFEKPFCRALIDLGYRDTMERGREVLDFLGFAGAAISPAAPAPRSGG